MSWPLKLVIKFGLVLILVPFGADLKRSRGEGEDDDEGHHSSSSPAIVPVLSVRNPENHGLGRTDLSKEFPFWDEEEKQNERIQRALEAITDDAMAEELGNLVHIGCYDIWEHKQDALHDQVWKGNNLGKCASYCEILNNLSNLSEEYIVGVRGESCFCPYMSSFTLVRISEDYCQLPCPDVETRTCGGNYSISAYCVLGGETTCSSFLEVPIRDLYAETSHPPPGDAPPRKPSLSRMNVQTKTENRISPREETAPVCGNCSHCYGTLTPLWDYIPENTPDVCIRFCQRRITYYRDRVERIREPTEYALCGWTNSSNTLVPACGCTNSLENVTEVSIDLCDTPCSSGHYCGSDNNRFMVTLYPTRDELGDGPGTPAHPEDPQVPEKTDPPPDSSSEEDSSELEETTTMMTTTTTTTTDTPELIEECNGKKKCQGIDVYGVPWTACTGDVPVKDCPNGATGQAFWKCLNNGEFEGMTPTYTSCSTSWIRTMQEELEGPIENSTAIQVLTKIQDLCVQAESLENKHAQYFGHEISSILNMTEQVVKNENLTQGTDLVGFGALTATVAHIGSSILINPRTWQQLSPTNSSKSATALLRTLEESSFELTEVAEAESTGQLNYTQPFQSRMISLAAGVVGVAAIGNGTLTFQYSESGITLPAGWTSIVPATENASYVGMAIDAGNEMDGSPFPNNISGLTGEEKALNGRIMSFSLTRPTEDNGSIDFTDIGGVNIWIQHNVSATGNGNSGQNLRRKLHFGEERKAILGTAVCVYWDTMEGIWSRDGCTLIESDQGTTLCECTHLTSFAVLFSYYNYVGKSIGLEVLTVVLSSLSVISLFATIVIFTVVRTTHGPRTTITKNLAFCLLIGNTLVLLVVDRNYFNMAEGVCIGAGILTHYAYLCAFMWMGIEGYHLYKMMVRVFDSGSSHMTRIRILAYGFPVIIVAVTGGVGILQNERAYGGEQFCWLNGNYVFAFMVPVTVVVCGNLIVLFITLRTAYQVQSAPGQIQQDRTKTNRTWVRGCFSITILLGITWIVGYLEMVNNSIVSEVGAYLFTILNASQGFLLFIFHCLLNEKVRMAAERRNIRYPGWPSASPTKTNTTSGQPSAPWASGSPVHRRFGKQNMKSFYSESVGAKEERRFGGGGPLESFNTFAKTKNHGVNNLSNNAMHGGGKLGTVSSSSSIVSSGNETNGSEGDLLPRRSNRK